jgi:putative transposase
VAAIAARRRCAYRRSVGRANRIQIPGGIYHVHTHAIRDEPIFVTDDDRWFFLWRLARVTRRCRWRIHAYVLMTTHFHLLVETPEPNLSLGMHMLNGVYAQRFNEVHGHQGHLVRTRFSDKLVESDAHLLEVARYLPLNAVRAGIVGHPADWPWSSYPATAGLAVRPSFLAVDRVLGYFGDDRREAQAAYRLFVLERLDDGTLAA